MGLAMARNVQNYLQREGGLALRSWNRTASRGAPLATLGAVNCESIAHLVTDVDIVFISVSSIRRTLLHHNIGTLLSVSIANREQD